MADDAAGLRGLSSRMENLDNQGNPHPTTPQHFLADLARLSAALAPWLLVEEGQPIGIDPAAPSDLLRAYGNLTSYGYAQGWL